VTKRVGLFDPRSFLAQVGEGRSVGNYSKDYVIYCQGDPSDAIFFIQSGKAKLTVVSNRGKEAVIAIINANEFFGEGGLVGQPLRIATVRTLTASVIVRLEKLAFLRVFRQEPAFAEFFMSQLLARTIRVESDLIPSCSIQAKSAWPVCSFYWRISVRKASLSQFSRK
jgi:CRP/FNR family cyclic AMP-dependent transcriptional regulator